MEFSSLTGSKLSYLSSNSDSRSDSSLLEISDYVHEENSIAFQGQKDENREDSGCTESDSFPLCYASFELLRHIIQISKQKHEFEIMENFMNCLEVEGKHVKKPIVCEEELTYKEEDEESQWNAPLNLSNSEISTQEKDFVRLI